MLVVYIAAALGTSAAYDRVRPFFVFLIAAMVAAAGCGGSSNDSTSPSPVAFSFVFVGCDRVLAADATPDNPSTANLAQLERDFAEIPRLKPRPTIAFVVGDLVLGLNADLAKLRDQLENWKKLYRDSPLGHAHSIRLVAIPGNHEMLIGSKGSQTSNPGAEDVWLDAMSEYIAGDNGPGPGGPDELATDQSRLTYSFRYRNTHFVVVNTDPYGAVATVPVHWIQNDLDKAVSNTAIAHIFVLGHKPAFVPAIATSGEQSLDVNPANRDAFWSEMNLADVDGYMAAHVHLWDISRPPVPDMPDLRHTWQVIAGNGGTRPDPGWAESGATPYFGYSQVIVYRSGAVEILSYGRDFDPQNYLAPSDPAIFPTTLRERVSIVP